MKKNIFLKIFGCALVFISGYAIGGLHIGGKAATEATKVTVITNLAFLNNIQENLRTGKPEVAKSVIDEAVNHDVWVLRNVSQLSTSALLRDVLSQPSNLDKDSQSILKSTSENFISKSNVLSPDNSIYISDLITHIN